MVSFFQVETCKCQELLAEFYKRARSVSFNVTSGVTCPLTHSRKVHATANHSTEPNYSRLKRVAFYGACQQTARRQILVTSNYWKLSKTALHRIWVAFKMFTLWLSEWDHRFSSSHRFIHQFPTWRPHSFAILVVISSHTDPEVVFGRGKLSFHIIQ